MVEASQAGVSHGRFISLHPGEGSSLRGCSEQKETIHPFPEEIPLPTAAHKAAPLSSPHPQLNPICTIFGEQQCIKSALSSQIFGTIKGDKFKAVLTAQHGMRGSKSTRVSMRLKGAEEQFGIIMFYLQLTLFYEYC